MSDVDQAPNEPKELLVETKDKVLALKVAHVGSESSAANGANGGAKSASFLPASPLSLLEFPFRHRKTILTCLLISAICAWFAIVFLPRAYISEAKIKIRVGRESMSVDPTVTATDTMLVQKTRVEEITSTLDVLGSRQVKQGVVDKLGANAILSGEVPTEGSSDEGSMLGNALQKVSGAVGWVLGLVTASDPVSDEELAVMQIGNSVSIWAPQHSSVITVESEAKSPEMAQLLINTTIDVFREIHTKSATTPGSLKFFESEAIKQEAELSTLIKQRSDFLRANDLVSIDANRSMLSDKLLRISSDIMRLQGELEQRETESKELSGTIALMKDDIVASRQTGKSATWGVIRQRVYDLQVAQERLKATYTDDHPKYIESQEQLGKAQAILNALEDEETNSSTTPNPEKASSRGDLRRLQTTIAGLKTALTEKEQQRVLLAKETQDLLEQERELIAMNRHIGVLESALSTVSGKTEQARLVAEIESQQISNISVVQPAALIQRPAKPNKKLVALFCIALGLFSGFGLAMLREYNDDTVRVREHLATSVNDFNSVVEIPLITDGALESNETATDRCRQILANSLATSPQRTSSDGLGRSIGVIGCGDSVGAPQIASIMNRLLRDEWLHNVTLLDWHEGKHDSQREQQFEDAIQDHETVIVNMPPAKMLGAGTQLMDQIVLVVGCETTQRQEVTQVMKRLDREAFAGPVVTAVILNGSRQYIPRSLARLVQA